MRNKIDLYINTIRYMNARQVAYRIYYAARGKLGYRPVRERITKDLRNLSLNYSNGVVAINSKEAQGILDEADHILNNQFMTISGRIVSFKESLDWDISGNKYRLVCFKLNSFSFLLDLSDAYKLTNKREYINYGFYLIDAWKKQCGQDIKGDKWNPYVIAGRLSNWICFCSQYCDKTKLTDYSQLIYQNAIQLKKTIEYQLDGNHLLSEGKALLLAGAFLHDPHIYKCGKRLLFREYKRQFLYDGGHYERSISYHIEAIQQYFESAVIMKMVDDSECEIIRDMLVKPYRFLNCMVGVDGHIPLLNDSAYDYPLDARDFLNTTKILYGYKAPNALEGVYSKRWYGLVEFGKKKIDMQESVCFQTGILHAKYSVGDREFSVFFDCGNNGAENIPAHVHADALSVLWSDDEGGILSDVGVWTYESGIDRDICRSTAVHNTVEIDGVNSAETWSAFRVARRGHTRIRDYNNDEELIEIKASHDGYSKVLRKPVIHTRKVKIDKDTGSMDIEDEIEGKGNHRGVLRFHISPGRCIEKTGYNTALIDKKYQYICSNGITIDDCKIAERFGITEKSKCIRVEFEINSKAKILSTFKML